MNWKLFLDDERYPVGDNWIIARSFSEVSDLIIQYDSLPSIVSFDHDLGKNQQTGYDVAKFIVWLDMENKFKLPEVFSWVIHSQNPVGAKNIDEYLKNYMKFKDSI